MKYQNKYRIAPNRWEFWDYSAPANYFITICTKDQLCVLGSVQNGTIILSESGQLVANEIQRIPTYNKRIRLDEWVVMPNHIHLIVTLGDEDYDNGLYNNKPDNVEKIHEFSTPTPNKTPNPAKNQPYKTPTLTEEIKQYRKQRRKMIIPKVVGKLKMQTSKQINFHNRTLGTTNWQPNYHDHVIRDEKSYIRIKQYIINNPAKWEDDKFYLG